MIIGLTGGIGTGKSTVAQLFEVLGYAVFNSDACAKQVYYEPALREKVIHLLGPEAYLSNDQINKSYISNRIFSDTLLLHQLNNIIHPAVKQKMAEFVAANQGKRMVKESALLFEAKLNKEVDTIVVVTAPQETVVQRVMKRDGVSREDVLKRIKSQIPSEDKEKHADFVIYNDEKQLLIPQVLKIHQSLQ